MARLSMAQVAAYARQGGFTGAQVPVAVAIAMAESGGNPQAVGDVGLETSTWGPSVGLWQIRSLNSQRGTGGQRDQTANMDPATNARHAHQIMVEAGGWRPWSTYTSGSYSKFLAGASSAANGPAADITAGPGAPAAPAAGASLLGGGRIPLPNLLGGAAAVTSGADALLTLGKAVSSAAVWLGDPNNWIRVAKVAVGGGLVLGGAYIAAKPWTDPVVQPIVRGAQTVAKAGTEAAAAA